jgi:shikimate kinase
MEEKIIINIGRQLGSGGREIGEKLSALLQIPFYDKELLQIASQESGLGKEFFEQADEKNSQGILSRLFSQNVWPNDEYSNYYLSHESLFLIQSDVIRKLADQHACIFIGRCADYVLKENQHCLNVFISADLNDRISRIAKLQQLSEKKAKELIEKTDKKRASYYNYYSNKVWGAAESYHLCINSSMLGIDQTVNFILEFAEKKFGR